MGAALKEGEEGRTRPNILSPFHLLCPFTVSIPAIQGPSGVGA